MENKKNHAANMVQVGLEFSESDFMPNSISKYNTKEAKF